MVNLTKGMTLKISALQEGQSYKCCKCDNKCTPVEKEIDVYVDTDEEGNVTERIYNVVDTSDCCGDGVYIDGLQNEEPAS